MIFGLSSFLFLRIFVILFLTFQPYLLRIEEKKMIKDKIDDYYVLKNKTEKAKRVSNIHFYSDVS